MSHRTLSIVPPRSRDRLELEFPRQKYGTCENGFNKYATMGSPRLADAMKDQQQQRAIAAFQTFLETSLATLLNRHQTLPLS
ncbi:MAG: hypothetical protein SVX43_00355 [Cyanobacteriota bacterium]|nr:hypothetical protein [Cyanobacteriota bacterium]